MKALTEDRTKGQVYCPICTHTVPADIDIKGRSMRVVQGQRCPRCQATLNVAVIVQVPQAA
jgi:transposase-like protein